jgi:hypothetical protein
MYFINIHALYDASLLVVFSHAVINLPQLEVGFNLGREFNQLCLQEFNCLLRFVIFVDKYFCESELSQILVNVFYCSCNFFCWPTDGVLQITTEAFLFNHECKFEEYELRL